MVVQLGVCRMKFLTLFVALLLSGRRLAQPVVPGGGVTGSAPIVVTGGVVSCPTCSTGGVPGGMTGYVQTNAGGGNFGGIATNRNRAARC